jgi:demethylmenaquinone methyltransferase/2-methoxy-6-polyprenyl-1,4-benzoquinol methylase
MIARGATPAGASNEREAASQVRRMFGRVARRYDLLNHLLSFQMDRWWRACTARRLSAILSRPDARVLDLCCGTGDLARALSRHAQARVYASDFCHPMLLAARGKLPRCPLFEGDALALPVASGSFDLLTVAFGFRNFANYRAGLAEALRVLKPGGALAILEFTTPPGRLFRALYRFYSAQILPRAGALISDAGDAYTYLPESVRKFPDAPTLKSELESAGFAEVEFTYMTCGVVALHVAYA